MCFEQLPIRFDGDGRAELVDDGSFEVPPALPLKDRPKGDRSFSIDPVTRVAGTLAFHTTVDLAAGRVTSAHAEALQFRGYELILRGRDPLEAIDISSRACGVCGGVHAVCSAMALEMAYGVVPPPMAVLARNLGEAAELFYDHTLHLFLLAGPDYSAQMVRRTNPSLWERSRRLAAPHAGTHGYVTMSDLMSALDPLEGELYRQALTVTRLGREIASLAFGKYPHPSAVRVGGLGTQLDRTSVNQILARIVRLVDFAKRAVAVWEDLTWFFTEADPAYRQVGVRRTNLVSFGLWDDPDSYDATYAHADDWGVRRACTPGVVVDGVLRTTRIRQVDLGVEEFVDHSYYDQWTVDGDLRTAPDSSPLSPYHPLNKQTVPRPEPRQWRERYSWSTAPRWDRQPMEAGPLARQWITATAGLVHGEFIDSGYGALDILLPAGELPEKVVHWTVPSVCNALERNRARAVHIAYCLMVGYEQVLKAFDELRHGEAAMTSPVTPRDGVGIGFWEGGRGALTHYAVIEGGRLANYQILTPSTWMASPRDPWGVPGPYEEAVLNTPILEETGNPDLFVGIDILRAIRSFDPCLPCAVHLDTGSGTIVRDATTCRCGDGS